MHWVGMNMRYAETTIAEAALDPARRDALFGAINRVASPLRTWQVARNVDSGNVQEAIDSADAFGAVFDCARTWPMGRGREARRWRPGLRA
jgi:hypothetical protein